MPSFWVGKGGNLLPASLFLLFYIRLHMSHYHFENHYDGIEEYFQEWTVDGSSFNGADLSQPARGGEVYYGADYKGRVIVLVDIVYYNSKQEPVRSKKPIVVDSLYPEQASYLPL